MDRPWVTRERIAGVCDTFATNWRIPEAWLHGRVLEALAEIRWPTVDQIALAASRECQAWTRKQTITGGPM